MSLTPNLAADIARDAFMWAYPVVDNYRVFHNFFVDKSHKEYKAPQNTVTNICRLYTDKDKSFQTPNRDTIYSWCLADLREDALVVTIPKFDHPNRYFTVQLIDLHCYNSDYISSRTVGTNGGNYLLVGPNWKGDLPTNLPNIDKIYHLDSDFITLLYRTQLFNDADLKNVEKLVSGYLVTPFKDFQLNNNCPINPPSKDLNKTAAPLPDLMKPLTVAELSTRVVEFFRILNYVLIWARLHPLDRQHIAPFQKYGLVFSDERLDQLRSQVWHGDCMGILKIAFDEETFKNGIDKMILEALPVGVQRAHEFQKQRMKELDDHLIQSFMYFGNREYIGNRYGDHMLGVIYGIYGQDKEEAVYFASFVDTDKVPLTCERNTAITSTTAQSGSMMMDDHKDDNTLATTRKTDPSHLTQYEYTFSGNSLPPGQAFWSLTLYIMPEMYLCPNEHKKWSVNNSMLDQFVRNKDGSITILIQHEKPEREEMVAANWLPAPATGLFGVILRCYAPTEDGYNGNWSPPEVINTTKHPEMSRCCQKPAQHTALHNQQMGLTASSTMQPPRHTQ